MSWQLACETPVRACWPSEWVAGERPTRN
jgi:uncharacterized protein (DUF1330 family)